MNEAALTLPSPLKLHMELTDEQFFQLCQHNRDLQFERTANGEILIMPPTGGETSNRNIELAFQVQAWSRQNKLGIAFDSNGGFILPNGATRAPDASWVRIERWEALTTEQREKFVPLCPDFVVELLSPSDSLKETQAKMQEYIDNGTRLGWLIIRKTQRVEIYRPNLDVEILENPTSLSGEDVLPGFVLDLRPIIS
ncbi:Uma2 family endonuclease [Chroococcidiopsis sp. FACHB-1243]|uniref:Uma2 family endonuclease n=1 Tax=Chroococcidiopsis sp. [FACHB-1243] TaxID=2692781 RepID=UPI00177AD09D|nr:Uma2 family endonuclease [Chroococcidiopsis sp. [FACHB-1243]]MBD2303961.1 Uma2 family endonuclease [Chroococcidiopsis sp. [FACHB-1243]]